MLRDKSNMAVGLLLPAALILLFGYGLSFDVKHAPLAVVMEDASPGAREAVQGLWGTAWRRPGAPTCPEAERACARARSTPSCACRRISRAPGGRAGARVQLVLNGSNSTTAQTLEGYVGGAIGLWSQRQAERAGGSRPAPASRWCSACGSTRRASAPGTWCPACWCWC